MPKEILDAVAQMFQQGMSEQEIFAMLVQNKVPEAQAKQAIEMVKQNSGGSESPAMPGKGEGKSKGYQTLRSFAGHVGANAALTIIAAVLDLEGGELNELVQELKNAEQQTEQGVAQAEGGGQQGQQQGGRPQGRPQPNNVRGSEI